MKQEQQPVNREVRGALQLVVVAALAILLVGTTKSKLEHTRAEFHQSELDRAALAEEYKALQARLWQANREIDAMNAAFAAHGLIFSPADGTAHVLCKETKP